jgi:GNAT superfamily N-acetyltransferase
MAWRLPRREWEAGRGAANRRALNRRVRRGPAPGVLAYDSDEPVGWCAIAPREEYVALERSRVLAPVDDRSVWSVSCFFVARTHRRQGLGLVLLRAALAHARRHGARLVEGYPVEPKAGWADVFAWTGIISTFLEAGFVEVRRRSPGRPIVRRALRPPRPGR